MEVLYSRALSTVVDRAASSVRDLLSGDPGGAPDYVHQLGLAGDRGLFGPGSVVWRVHADAAMLLGGVRALVLQALDPLAVAGVQQHSRFREDPLGRLRTTARFVTVVTFATSEIAERECLLVRSVHERVRGVAPDGRAYAASDPFRLRHVHLSLVDSFLTAYQLFSPEPLSVAEADDYVTSMNRLGGLLGFDEVALPGSVGELRSMLTPGEAGLAVNAQTLSMFEFLRRPPLPALQQIGYRFLYGGAVASLPTPVRDLVPGAPFKTGALRARVEALLLLEALRSALGTSPALHAALGRCADAGVLAEGDALGQG